MSHFYHPKTGELIDGNLRDARKVNGLPSPTTVLSLLKGEGLIFYFKKMMWEATSTTPRPPGMSDEDHFSACLKWADEHSKNSRETGGDFHLLVQKFHERCMKGFSTPEVMPVGELQEQFYAYVAWYRSNVRRSLMVEQAVIGQGYAGRVDHVAEMMDGKVLCLDVKTQDTTKKKGKFTYYDQWPIQLGAYAGACKIPIDGLMSVAVSANLPAIVETKLWERPVEYYHDIFLGLLKFWKHSNSYFPE